MEELLNFALPEYLWWEQIAGPARLISAIQSALLEGHCVICEISTALSFRRAFRDTVSHWVSSMDIATEEIECDDYQGEDIEEYLIGKLFPSVLDEYRRRKTPQYMKINGLLDGRLVWVRHVPAPYLRQWVQYISSHRSRDTEHGLFVMETLKTDSQLTRNAQNLRFLSVYDYISQADLRSFISILAERMLTDSDGIRQYVVELITDLCGTDAELAQELLETPDWYFQDPCETLIRMYQEAFADSPRGTEDGHPFDLIRRDQTRQLKNRVWTAQIRIGYPKIEIERCSFIQHHFAELKQALEQGYYDPVRGCGCFLCDNEGNRCNDPFDLEVGVLVKMSYLTESENGRHLLYLPDPQEWNRLNLLRECRNKLAHLDVCSGEDFRRLLT